MNNESRPLCVSEDDAVGQFLQAMLGVSEQLSPSIGKAFQGLGLQVDSSGKAELERQLELMAALIALEMLAVDNLFLPEQAERIRALVHRVFVGDAVLAHVALRLQQYRACCAARAPNTRSELDAVTITLLPNLIPSMSAEGAGQSPLIASMVSAYLSAGCGWWSDAKTQFIVAAGAS